jgi:SAM-dependent methyltransferase
LLDVGSASGDMSGSIQRVFPEARVVSLDCRHFHVKHARGSRVVGDAFGLPFRPRSFDFVFCSLLLHEYSDEAALLLMKRFHEVAKKALIVVDLYRHPLAVRFLPATSWLFNWGDVTLHDGPVSVRAAFRRWELRELAAKAGLGDVEVRRHLPWFRISMVAGRNGV